MSTKLGRSSLQRGPLCRGFHQHVLLWNSMSRGLSSRVVISGVKHLSHRLCFLLQVAGGVSRPTMNYMNYTRPHYQKHPRHAKSWSRVAARKGVVAAASAKRLHSNALLSVCVKENVPQNTEDVSQFRTDGICICISTEIHVLFTLLVC